MFVNYMKLERGSKIEVDWASGNDPEEARKNGAKLAELYESQGWTVTRNSNAVRA